MGGGHKSILTRLAEEFEQLAAQLNPPVRTIEIGKFTQACRLVSPLIRQLGVAVQFADIEYSAKVTVIEEARKSVNTPEQLLDCGIQQKTFMLNNSPSGSLIIVKCSLEMLKIIFEQTMASSGNSIVDPVIKAYDQVFRRYLGRDIRQVFPLETLPTRSKFFEAVELDETSALVQMRRIVDALDPLIQYIDNLFRSRGSAQGLRDLI